MISPYSCVYVSRDLRDHSLPSQGIGMRWENYLYVVKSKILMDHWGMWNINSFEYSESAAMSSFYLSNNKIALALGHEELINRNIASLARWLGSPTVHVIHFSSAGEGLNIFGIMDPKYLSLALFQCFQEILRFPFQKDE